MRPANLLPAFVALILGAVFALLTAWVSANVIESRSQGDVARVLELSGHDWVTVEADGLQVKLGGTAPDEASRFRALAAAGTVVDASRVIDQMGIEDPDAITPPRFSIEILRNDEGISLIGLVPASMDRETIVQSIQQLSGSKKVADLLDSADYPTPEGWDKALAFGLDALGNLPRSKISIAAGHVAIKAISDSPEEKKRLESLLAGKAPAGVQLTMEISAPRPVISPYTLRFLIDESGPHFDACSTFTPAGRERILAAAHEAGMLQPGNCTIGLGIPSPTWDEAVITAIHRLAELGGGSVTFSDADVTLVAPQGTPQEKFDAVVGELKSDLPDAFSLHAVLPEPEKKDGEGKGPPEFIATRSPEGDVRLRGLIPDERIRTATASFAMAQFGAKAVRDAMRIEPELPDGWVRRVLASLEALGQLNSGSALARPDIVEIRGLTGNPDARAEIARILSEKLGSSQDFKIDVTYEKKLDPKENIPSPQECVDQINQVLKVQQITFAPNSADIDEVARASIDHIAEILKKCQDVRMEVGGHTDSQGREIMNLSLSQARAEAVINALLSRRVLTTNLVAKGYGETQPIADNKTEAGRNANRRIEFKLLEQDAKPADDSPSPETQTGDTASQAPQTSAPSTDAAQTGNSDEQN